MGILFWILILYLFTISACDSDNEDDDDDNDATYEEIVAALNNLYPLVVSTENELIDYYKDILENSWSDEKFFTEETAKSFLYELHKTGKLNDAVKDCMLKTTRKYMTDERLIDKKFADNCNYKKYLETIDDYFLKLSVLESSAVRLPTDFVNSTQSCLEDGDPISCGVQVLENALETAREIYAVIDMTEDAINQIEDDYEDNAEYCKEAAVTKSNFLEEFFIEAALFCLKLGSEKLH